MGARPLLALSLGRPAAASATASLPAGWHVLAHDDGHSPGGQRRGANDSPCQQGFSSGQSPLPESPTEQAWRACSGQVAPTAQPVWG